MVDWAEVKKDFPAASSYAYFKAGSGGILSRAAAGACAALYQDWSTHGDLHFRDHEAELTVLKENLLLTLGFQKDRACAYISQIALTTNSSEGMNHVAFLATKNGSETLNVVSLWNEFPSVTLPWVNKGSKLHLVPQGDVECLGVVDAVRQMLLALPKDCQACLAVSHVSFADGSRLPLNSLSKVCAEVGAWFFVDASQSFGIFPVDVQAACIDGVVCNGYKWLCAGYGAGFAYMSGRLLAHYDKAPAVGWHNVLDMDDISQFQLQDGASRFQDGAPAFPGLVALHASLRFFQSLGWDSITDRVLYLNARLSHALQSAGYDVVSPLVDAERSGNLVVKIYGYPKAIAAALKDRGVVVKDQKESLRISTHIYNDECEIDRLVGELLSISPPHLAVAVDEILLGSGGPDHPLMLSGPGIVEHNCNLVVVSGGEVRSTGPCAVVLHVSLHHHCPQPWAEGIRLVSLEEEGLPAVEAKSSSKEKVLFECVVHIGGVDQGVRTVGWQLHDMWDRALGVMIFMKML